MTTPNISRRDLNRASLSLLAAVTAKAFGATARATTEVRASTRPIHRVSRNASATEAASLLAIYIAPAGATPEELMKPI